MKQYTVVNLFTGEIIQCRAYSRNRARRRAVNSMKDSINCDRQFGYGHPTYREVYSREKNVVYFIPVIKEEHKIKGNTYSSRIYGTFYSKGEEI